MREAVVIVYVTLIRSRLKIYQNKLNPPVYSSKLLYRDYVSWVCTCSYTNSKTLLLTIEVLSWFSFFLLVICLECDSNLSFKQNFLLYKGILHLNNFTSPCLALVYYCNLHWLTGAMFCSPFGSKRKEKNFVVIGQKWQQKNAILSKC